ncbi:Deubiquitination-protection protein dph1 [Ceratocystis fimbriata CBS 114723]|uniref:Deubiquitination-protection protein dph1 n=1 Tax=Ceratocystis fimbriata CBS 114723 TaxID=1035309 RepID=A0A2C5WUA8_9PEZI|nr:Deubiquitination-protection protein dph1 [Ceratocystis fimbriata CBS 114723]
MADSTPAATDDSITFKVKASGDRLHTITISQSVTVKELKVKLSGETYENIPIERQRLIYAGRVMKNDDTLVTYKIKPNNTIHLVKSAASNATPSSASSTLPAAAAVPTNIATGVNNDPLAGLTGARYAGHVQLPSRDLFGADGGMGAPPNEDELARMLDDPSVQQTLNAALDNPQFIDQMIRMNPQLASIPNVREMFQSPFMRHMLTNPDMMRMSARMSRSMGGAGGSGFGSFPAPGVTDSTPGTTTTDSSNPPASTDGSGAGATSGSTPNPAMPWMMNSPFGIPPPGAFGGANPAENPFLALFNPSGTGAGATSGANTSNNRSAAPGDLPPNPLSLPGISPFSDPDALQEVMSLFQGMNGGVGTGAPTPVDNRPPEERYADQLRQLNDMGFFDFDRNIAALRRSGGSVQGAIEHLL